jgi:hypothetical protein
MSQIAMPEWIQRQDRPGAAWTVQEGQPIRGDAWTEMVGRVMRVPTGEDGTSRVIRAHEMMHSKVSPWTNMNGDSFGVSNESIIAAEEYRVNTLIGVAGFDLDELRDGSEGTSGKRYGENKDWNGTVIYTAALAGTKACADFIRGMKTTNPEQAEAAREVEKAVVKMWTQIAKQFVYGGGRGRKALTPSALAAGARIIGSTSPTATKEGVLPDGYVRFTIPLARLLDGFMIREDENDPGETVNVEDVKEVARAGSSGHYAAMILDTDVVLSRRVDGSLGRKRIASATGRNPRHMSRLLTDPERRVFDRKVKGKGGIVLIDQSGSMRLTEKNLWDIIEAAPGCTIIGYSHRPGSTTTPNVWVLAERGKVCEKLREGNGGNGVDGPAIKFAATKRRGNEPFIWVCDGMVTDSEDQNSDLLAEKAARLVVRHGIHMAYNVDDAVAVLKKAATGRLAPNAVGEISRTKAWRENGRG